MRTLLATLCATFLIVLSNSASAVPITGLFSTGLDNVGNYLAAGASDGNYTVTASPNGPLVPVAIDDTAYPFPPWAANNSPNSRWIGLPSAASRGPAGNYIYRTTFSLPASADLSTAIITGAWGTDNVGTDILFNGASTSNTSNSFTSLTFFSITSGFVAGSNTLDFIVNNSGFGPTGLRVDRIRGKYDRIPEPGTCFLAAIGIGGLLVARQI